MEKTISKRALEEKDIVKKVKQTIKKYEMLKDGDTIIVGVSGGPDSMALLNILWNICKEGKINFTIVVAHFNHALRKEADEETKYVEQYCKKRNISCYIKKQNVEQYAKEQRIGIEEAGRKLRYAFFEEVAKKQKAPIKIATAHQANDNAETVFMNILRGTGTAGLKGIEPKRNLLIRPLIHIQRNEIEVYCQREQLNPKIDTSNFENQYTRNRVRNMLFPFINQNFDANIVMACNRMADICREEDDYLEKVAKKSLSEMKENLGKQELEEKNLLVLSLKKFNLQEEVIQKRIIMLAIQKVLGNSQEITKINIEDIVHMCQKQIGNKYMMPNSHIKISIQKQKIFFEKIK